MDFVLAVFPWIITWKLDIRRIEKIGLCLAMSLVSRNTAITTSHLNTTMLIGTAGHGRCHCDRNSHTLEGRGQSERRLLLLEQRALQHLVFLRSRRNHHRPMHPRIATSTPRHTHNPHVKAAG